MFDRLSLRRGGARQDDLRLDEYLPEYDVTQLRHAVVDAPVGVTYQAIRTADLTETGPVVAALSSLRVFPEIVAAIRGGEPAEPMPERLTFGDIEESGEWVRLADEPDSEFAFGAVGRFWQPAIEWREVDAESFADFEQPGWGKIGASLSVRPYGSDRTLLTFEARTATTDADSRRRFRRYWRLIGPFAGYVMGRALDRIATDAETAYAMAGGDAAEAEAVAAEIQVG